MPSLCRSALCQSSSTVQARTVSYRRIGLEGALLASPPTRTTTASTLSAVPINAETRGDCRAWRGWTGPPAYLRDFGQPGCAERPREKGFDVALAIDLVSGALNRDYDTAVLFSRDTDLLPAVEMVYGLYASTGAAIEVGGWRGASRLRFRDRPNLPYCHNLNEAEWQGCVDHTDYIAVGEQRRNERGY